MGFINGFNRRCDRKLIIERCLFILHAKLGPCDEALQKSTYCFPHVFVEVIFHMKNTLAEILSHYDSGCFKSLQVFQQHLFGGTGDHPGELSQSYGTVAQSA